MNTYDIGYTCGGEFIPQMWARGLKSAREVAMQVEAEMGSGVEIRKVERRGEARRIDWENVI
ncbi:MAG: hypothetical protein J6X53_09420 [Abditibacteriota bacterium]|nr:hypothetical protein [Abditibacteriota bacterium]